jgi:hypothetical protein
MRDYKTPLPHNKYKKSQNQWFKRRKLKLKNNKLKKFKLRLMMTMNHRAFLRN